jgi:hypothetical protein
LTLRKALLPLLPFGANPRRIRDVVARRQFVAALVGVCILSAAVGSGITLLAERGPAGPRGPEGPPGRSADIALIEAEEALDLANSVELRLAEFESEVVFLVEREARRLEDDVEEFEAAASTICRSLEAYC